MAAWLFAIPCWLSVHCVELITIWCGWAALAHVSGSEPEYWFLEYTVLLVWQQTLKRQSTHLGKHVVLFSWDFRTWVEESETECKVKKLTTHRTWRAFQRGGTKPSPAVLILKVLGGGVCFEHTTLFTFVTLYALKWYNPKRVFPRSFFWMCKMSLRCRGRWNHPPAFSPHSYEASKLSAWVCWELKREPLEK